MEDRFAPPPSFADTAPLLHELVSQQLGSDDFGAPDYRAGLDMLLLSLDYDPRLTGQGRRIAWGEIYKALYGRAHAFQQLRQHPGCDQPVTAPVVITGLPRTGTTALHKLLALDPQFQGLQTWLIGAPMPRPPRATWEEHPQFQAAVEQLQRRHAAVPDRRAAHLMVADEVDECCLVMRQGFVSNIWSCMWTATSYDLWLQTQSERHCYDYLRQVLQLIGSSEPQKRWLLKNPGHIAQLDQLLAVFPDARVIQTHRDPAKAIPSLAAMLIRNHDVVEEGRRDLRARLMGIRETEKWAKAIRDAEAVRQRHPDQFLDVVHADFHHAPLAIVERIYDFIGAELTPAVRAAMQQRIVDDPERQHGVHRYHVNDFGLTEAAIRERFGDYVARFDLAPSSQPNAGATV